RTLLIGDVSIYLHVERMAPQAMRLIADRQHGTSGGARLVAIIAAQYRAGEGAAIRRLLWSKLQHSFRCKVYLMVEPDRALILRRPAPPQGKLRMMTGGEPVH